MLRVFRLGRLSYEPCLALQRRLRDALVARSAAKLPTRDEGALLLVEHDPVYTLGRVSTEDNLLFDPAAPGAPAVVRVERGGEVTHHAPGQLVAYPVLDLDAALRRDLHWYVRALEQAVIDTLAGVGLAGHREEGLTGVWVGDEKVAAVGIGVKRWVAYHGLALNVAPDLAGFARIVPCGIEDRAVCSLQSLGVQGVGVEDVRPLLENALAGALGVRLGWGGGVEELERHIASL